MAVNYREAGMAAGGFVVLGCDGRANSIRRGERCGRVKDVSPCRSRVENKIFKIISRQSQGRRVNEGVRKRRFFGTPFALGGEGSGGIRYVKRGIKALFKGKEGERKKEKNIKKAPSRRSTETRTIYKRR